MDKQTLRDQLSAAGVQYGHQTQRWNPKMAPYIYAAKSKNHIIDLEKTITQLEIAQKLMSRIGAKGDKVLFVGTRKSAKLAVKEAALRSGNFYVNQRWLGGTLTNLKTILIRIKALWQLEEEEKNGKLALRTKKEQILVMKEKTKLEKALGGIKQMRQLPAALVVIDPKSDEIAVKEALKLRIPVIALCDTNVDPDIVTMPIPGNDDLPEAVNIIVNLLVDAYAEGANLVMPESVLKTVMVKRERPPFEGQEGERPNYRRENKPNHTAEGTEVLSKPSAKVADEPTVEESEQVK